MDIRRADATFAYYYAQGTEHRAYEAMGAHPDTENGTPGFRFCVYAPSARSVQVAGDFNGWNGAASPLSPIEPNSGMWEVFVPGAEIGQCYKYAIEGQDGVWRMKADPYGFSSQLRSASASILVGNEPFPWTDEAYFKTTKPPHESPVNIYEVHLFSWIQACTPTSGIDLDTVGEELAQYAHKMHYTHIELMPVMEHPLDDSWGYQVTGFYALTGRIGHPDKLRRFVNRCHELGVGVILDWVPGHFCRDEQGLFAFDGTDLYGWEDHPHWGTRKFDFARGHVQSFLISCAQYWMREFHVDGLRTDGVASIIDLNYGISGPLRKNRLGGGSNLEALDFLRKVNASLHAINPNAVLCAEDSSTFPGITLPQEFDGLGFNLKWDMGWMHDTLNYLATLPFCRKDHHHALTFSMSYNFSENFLLSLSHDEVVHGKHSIIGRMPGTYDEQFAQVRLLMAWQITHPGKKLNFMGNEFGQFMEWRFYEPLEFFMLKYPRHSELWNFNKDLNELYLQRKELWELDRSWEGFQWIQADNADDSVYVYARRDKKGHEIIVLLNMAGVDHEDFPIGLSHSGTYRQLINSDAYCYGGQNRLIEKNLHTKMEETDRQPYTLHVRLPGLTAILLERTRALQQRNKKTSKGE